MIDIVPVELTGVDLIKSVNNFSDEDILLVGACVIAFERVQYLMSCQIAENNQTDAKDLPKLLDKTGGTLADEVKKKFGDHSSDYKIFKVLVDDRNAIVHAYGLPQPEDDKMQRYHIKEGKIEAKIDTEFMKDFIHRCFVFYPVYDFKKALKSIRNGGQK